MLSLHRRYRWQIIIKELPHHRVELYMSVQLYSCRRILVELSQHEPVGRGPGVQRDMHVFLKPVLWQQHLSNRVKARRRA